MKRDAASWNRRQPRNSFIHITMKVNSRLQPVLLPPGAAGPSYRSLSGTVTAGSQPINTRVTAPTRSPSATTCATIDITARRRSLHAAPSSAATETMSETNTKLTAAIEAYFADLGRVHASGGATGERSRYGPLANLLNAIGATLKPKVFCVGELADQGAGHPDFGLYAAKQVQKGRPREGQTPERGVVEVKPAADDAWLTAEGAQVSRYWGRYRLVLVTNTRDFVLLGEDASGRPAKLETFRLAGSAQAFERRLEKPRAFARNLGAGLGEYLARAPSHRAALAEPKDLAWLLASYAPAQDCPQCAVGRQVLAPPAAIATLPGCRCSEVIL